MAFVQTLGMMAGAAALGKISGMGDLTQIKALNPFDVFDAESVNLTPQDGAILNNMGNEAANLTTPAQGALLGLAVSTPGGGALFRKKVITALAMGAVAGGVVGFFVGKRR